MHKFILLLLSLIVVAKAHYGDPNDGGCEKDEQPVKIQGLAGDFCSPPCDSSGGCPTDVPQGVTAKPTCALTSSSGAKYCALICNPSTEIFDNVCGKNATCKAIQSTGICTYNDTPQPPSSYSNAQKQSFKKLPSYLRIFFVFFNFHCF